MPVQLQVDLTSFHIVNNLFDMGLEFITIPQLFEFTYSKKNVVRPTMNDFVIEHWKTPPQSLTINGITRFRVLQNFLGANIPWAVNLDTIKFGGSSSTSEQMNPQYAGLLPVADLAYWLINKMGLEDQRKLSDLLGFTTKTEIDANLKGSEDRVRTWIYFNYSIYEVMFDRVRINRAAKEVVFHYDINFVVLDYKNVYDYIFKGKIGQYIQNGIIGADVLAELIKA